VLRLATMTIVALAILATRMVAAEILAQTPTGVIQAQTLMAALVTPVVTITTEKFVGWKFGETEMR